MDYVNICVGHFRSVLKRGQGEPSYDALVSLQLTVVYDTVQSDTVQYDTVQYDTVQSDAMQYDTVQYDTMQSCRSAVQSLPIAVLVSL